MPAYSFTTEEAVDAPPTAATGAIEVIQSESTYIKYVVSVSNASAIVLSSAANTPPATRPNSPVASANSYALTQGSTQITIPISNTEAEHEFTLTGLQNRRRYGTTAWALGTDGA